VPESTDIFISYAHADDEVPEGARTGWVTTLVVELKKILRRKLGGSGAAVWMDHQLAGDENVSDELRARLRESRTLVLVMSPGYLKSQWCQRELANFLREAGGRGVRPRVFLVEIEPIERDSWPRGLQDLELTPVRFWEKTLERPEPYLVGYPNPPRSGSSVYWKNLNELAHWIAGRLGADAAAPGGRKRVVVIAEATDDLDEQRESVTALLRQHEFEAVPLRAYPRDTEAAYLDAVRRDLRDAALFVQLLGRWEGKALEDGGASIVALQAREALAAHRERGLAVLQWREGGLDPLLAKSEAHRVLLQGPFVQASGFEQFRREVLRALKVEVAAAPAPAPAAVPIPNGGFSVFVKADDVDTDLAGAACESLKGLDVVPVPSASNGHIPFPRALERQLDTISRCDGVLFVYGESSLGWLTAQVGYASRVMGLRPDHVWGAVLDAPAPGRPKVPFVSPHLLNLDCRNGFDPAKIGQFVQVLRERGGRPRA
jgi:hypothetical protein